MIAAIAAVDKNWGIGYQGDLLAHIPEDLQHFKSLTEGNTIVMGRKTWDSLPNKPLPNRFNMIITHGSENYFYSGEEHTPSWFLPLDKALLTMLHDDIDDYFIIGGGEVYKALLPLCDIVYVTKIDKEYENVDTYFPNLDEAEDWEVSTRSAWHNHNNIPYAFLTYERV